MPREKDARYQGPGRSVSSRAAPAGAPPAERGDRRRASRSSAITGSPASFEAPPQPTERGFVESALDSVRDEFTEQLGFQATETPEFVPDPYVQQTSAGTAVVHLHQQYQGIPLFEMSRNVQFPPTQGAQRIIGDSASLPDPLTTVPALTAIDALRLAAAYLAEHDDEPEEDAWGQVWRAEPFQLPADYAPRVISAFDRPNRPTVLDRGPFGQEVEATLVFFHTGPRIVLCWKFLLVMPDLDQRYLVLVAADRPPADVTSTEEAVLLCQPTSAGATANVFLFNPGVGPRERVELPRLVQTYPLNGGGFALPDPFPDGWWVIGDKTIGNCAVSVHAADDASFAGAVDGDEVSFDPPDPEGAAQQLVNAFFFCNYMHDFFYLLGFDEVAGNFQKTNFTSGGTASDAVLVRVHPQAIPKTATFLPSADGIAPSLRLGTVTLADHSSRHTALDADVVFHEYVHGVSNRLVGGRMNTLALQQPQSRGLGEGWGDYFALTIQSHGRAVEKVVLGDWVTGNPQGLRSAPYDEHYPNGFGQLGVPPFTKEHRIGEIWCATLMQMNRNLDATLGTPAGHQLGWQIVVDGLKLTPTNPSFLDARDAILTALEDLGRSGRLDAAALPRARRAAWDAFAQFGLGAEASCDGASLQNIVEDHTRPPGV